MEPAKWITGTWVFFAPHIQGIIVAWLPKTSIWEYHPRRPHLFLITNGFANCLWTEYHTHTLSSSTPVALAWLTEPRWQWLQPTLPITSYPELLLYRPLNAVCRVSRMRSELYDAGGFLCFQDTAPEHIRVSLFLIFLDWVISRKLILLCKCTTRILVISGTHLLSHACAQYLCLFKAFRCIC